MTGQIDNINHPLKYGALWCPVMKSTISFKTSELINNAKTGDWVTFNLKQIDFFHSEATDIFVDARPPAPVYRLYPNQKTATKINSLGFAEKIMTLTPRPRNDTLKKMR